MGFGEPKSSALGIKKINPPNTTGPPLWLQARKIFETLLDYDTSEQHRLLNRLCGDSAALRKEVLSLLACERNASMFVHEYFSTLVSVNSGAIHIGDRIHSYRIIRRLGQGGMGTVYLAERTDDALKRQVALKFICRDPDPKMTERFRREREILAHLDHRNITKLLDAGSTDDGVHYYVMEYVKGAPIDEYCEIHRPDIDARLDLFMQVCSAVGVAHQNLILHRDLKPANIMVTDEGAVKLLDFGIAQVIPVKNPGAHSARLSMSGFIMTPLYASPEQIRRQPLTTASDQYSLGVLLYRLLTDRDPYPDSGGLRELEHKIINTVPVAPSKVVLKTKPTAQGWELHNRLRGDLDVIVLKALNKKPQRRYTSVLALRDDIRRHRGGLPVTVRKRALCYRGRECLDRGLRWLYKQLWVDR